MEGEQHGSCIIKLGSWHDEGHRDTKSMSSVFILTPTGVPRFLELKHALCMWSISHHMTRMLTSRILPMSQVLVHGPASDTWASCCAK